MRAHLYFCSGDSLWMSFTPVTGSNGVCTLDSTSTGHRVNTTEPGWIGGSFLVDEHHLQNSCRQVWDVGPRGPFLCLSLATLPNLHGVWKCTAYPEDKGRASCREGNSLKWGCCLQIILKFFLSRKLLKMHLRKENVLIFLDSEHIYIYTYTHTYICICMYIQVFQIEA